MREVIDTFSIASDMGAESLSAYIISMARNPSDVLAVELLKREARFLVSVRHILRPEHLECLFTRMTQATWSSATQLARLALYWCVW